MRVVADSSFLVALFYPPDVHHDEAVEQLKKSELIYVHYDVLKEALTVLIYRLGAKRVKEILEKIVGSEVFEVSYFGLEDVTGFWLSLDRKISYFDAVGIMLSLKLGVDLLTFDKEQEKILSRLKHGLETDR